MEIRVLRYFLETAREGNMTRAAERLFISQPTMSKQLKELERELGVKLFKRSNYNIKLTEAGMLLRERAEDILSLVDKTLDEFRSIDDLNSGDIYVGAPESDAMEQFMQVVRDLQKRYHGIRCHIYSGNMQDVCEKLDNGLLDFGIVMNYVDLKKYNYLPMASEDTWGVIMRCDDPLAENDAFTIPMLKDLPLICSRQWVDYELPQWLDSDSKEINISATYNLPYNGAMMAKAGIGYALMLDKVVHTSQDSELVFRPLLGAPKVEMYIIRRKYQTLTAVSQLLVKALREKFDDQTR